MEFVDAYNFMKKIIRNGVEKRYSITNIKKGVKDYLNVLKEQNSLTEDELILLTCIAQRTEEIIGNRVGADELFSRIFDSYSEYKRNRAIKDQMRTSLK
jgi:hypothetical protein